MLHSVTLRPARLLEIIFRLSRPWVEARVNRWLEGRPLIDRGVSGDHGARDWPLRKELHRSCADNRHGSQMTEKDVRELAEQVAEWAERCRAAGLVRKESRSFSFCPAL